MLPWTLGLIALATFVLLFLMTGSLLVPVKALLLNVLSLTATFGAMVWIFQEGHLSDLLGFTPTGSIDIFTPILMFCIAFGLSMDYEVFLLSRIKEEYDLDRDNEHAVAGRPPEDRAGSSPPRPCSSRSSSSGSRPRRCRSSSSSGSASRSPSSSTPS